MLSDRAASVGAEAFEIAIRHGIAYIVQTAWGSLAAYAPEDTPVECILLATVTTAPSGRGDLSILEAAK